MHAQVGGEGVEDEDEARAYNILYIESGTGRVFKRKKKDKGDKVRWHIYMYIYICINIHVFIYVYIHIHIVCIAYSIYRIKCWQSI